MARGIVIAGAVVLLLIGLYFVANTYFARAQLSGGPGPVGGGLYFNHIVVIAMENKHYDSVLGTGNGTSSAPFLTSLLPRSATIPQYHSYGSTGSIGGCSAGCYVALTTGSDQSESDGWCPTASSPCLNVANIASEMSSAGLASAAFCEDGCRRGADHFPWIGYNDTWNGCVRSFASCDGQVGTGQVMPLYNAVSRNSGSWFGVSTVGDTELIDYLNSANPANLIWFTPDDTHNMHGNSISSGDEYLQSLLVGTGSLASPGAGSILSTSLFTNPANRAILYIWWDEYDPSPNVEYGRNVKAGLVSSANDYDEFASLHTLEKNWGLGTLGNDAKAPVMTDLFVDIGSNSSTVSTTTTSATGSTTGALATSFTYTPNHPRQASMSLHRDRRGGDTAPCAFTWSSGIPRVPSTWRSVVGGPNRNLIALTWSYNGQRQSSELGQDGRFVASSVLQGAKWISLALWAGIESV